MNQICLVSMDNVKELSLKIIEILAKKETSPIEKKLQALIRKALLSDNLLRYIQEVQIALSGHGKVHASTVKGLVEYAMAHNEVEIRHTVPDELQDRIVEQDKYRLTQAEVWLLGALAHLGLLE